MPTYLIYSFFKPDLLSEIVQILPLIYLSLLLRCPASFRVSTLTECLLKNQVFQETAAFFILNKILTTHQDANGFRLIPEYKPTATGTSHDRC